MVIGEVSPQVLATQATEHIAQDGTKDIAAKKENVAASGQIREQQNDRVQKLLEDAEKAKEKAAAAAKKLDETGKVAGIFVGASRAEEAAELAHKAQMIQADIMEAQAKAQEEAKAASEAIDKIKDALQVLEQAKNDIENISAAADRMSKEATGG